MTWTTSDKQRWVVNKVDTLTVETVKALAGSSKYSMGKVLDMAVEYFSRHVQLSKEGKMKWELPDDY